jgi:hypothetical protein
MALPAGRPSFGRFCAIAVCPVAPIGPELSDFIGDQLLIEVSGCIFDALAAGVPVLGQSGFRAGWIVGFRGSFFWLWRLFSRAWGKDLRACRSNKTFFSFFFFYRNMVYGFWYSLNRGG